MKKYHNLYRILKVFFFLVNLPTSLYFFLREVSAIGNFLSITSIFLTLSLITLVLIKLNKNSKLLFERRYNSDFEYKRIKEVSYIFNEMGHFNLLRTELKGNSRIAKLYFDKKDRVTENQIEQMLIKTN